MGYYGLLINYKINKTTFSLHIDTQIGNIFYLYSVTAQHSNHQKCRYSSTNENFFVVEQSSILF